ncbi:hypothetical protein MoryE10_14630 [Methylogaea oryzae]|uniref:Transglycosylase SLT domain-containing protein n=1 Tax=Methylogaea oryzae TaxID=1295382 RepID=A0A8D4VQN6_9GAMM|nr:hypothetical protein MoryE10_14630 [Methylogaea oryzae]
MPLRHRALALGVELIALSAAALVAIIAVLGRSANGFAGTDFGSSLLPFAGAVFALVVVGAGLLWLWLRLRRWLTARFVPGAALLALGIALAAGWFALQDEYGRDLGNFRTLVGGMQEAERVTLAHQVYASYRRSDLSQAQRLLERARPYLPPVQEAAGAYGIDTDVLMGVGATESSFLPRDSKDGGRGLFQITAPPKAAVELAKERLGVEQLDLNDPRHNAHVAAATLRHYFAEMRGDLFLGLLAYNIGPKNGGLLSIMKQYGARDFATIQPYLQNLPRDYPIRVLTAALAARLWRTEGALPRYEQGDNALRIQGVGIPGL